MAGTRMLGRNRLIFILAAVVALASSMLPAQAQLFETKAKQAFMIDADTGTVLFAKDPDKPIPPASLAKLMTMEVVFHAIKAGNSRSTIRFRSARTPGARVARCPVARPCSRS